LPLVRRDDRRAERQTGGLGNSAEDSGIAKDDGHALAGDRRVGEQVQADLWTDTGGIAHRDGNAGQAVHWSSSYTMAEFFRTYLRWSMRSG
jgi:hypothetical protein